MVAFQIVKDNHSHCKFIRSKCMHVESITPIWYYHVQLEKLHLNSAMCYVPMRECAGSVAEQQSRDLTRYNLSSAIHFCLKPFLFLYTWSFDWQNKDDHAYITKLSQGLKQNAHVS